MDVKDLSRDQLVTLKQSYMTQLADEGVFSEIMNTDYDEPSWYDLANADKIVSDEVIFNNYEGIDFVPEDFAA